MDYVKLGRTNLNVSVAGLGCGGNSKLGLWRGKDKAHAVSLVRRALELGVNFIDTANSYGTEEAVGEGIKGVTRDDVVISTKYHPAWDGKIHSNETIIINSATVKHGLVSNGNIFTYSQWKPFIHM